MNALPELRCAALEIFQQALAGVDARAAVRRAVRLEWPRLFILDTSVNLKSHTHGNIYAIAIGKAALHMAATLDEILRERLTAGLLTGPLEHDTQAARSLVRSPEVSFSKRWRIFEGGHPLPNEASLEAARYSLDLLRRADAERALVIFLISGGGSAMLEWPNQGHATLADLREANRVIVSCGASIAEINSVRRAFSAIKGGGLAAHAPHADQFTLIISDTGAGDEANVASGPTLEPKVDEPDAASVVARYGLAASLPASLLSAINSQARTRTASLVTTALRRHYVLLDNQHALEAASQAARAGGFTVEIAPDLLEQPVAEGCAALLSRLRDLQSRARGKVCLISGGEFSCPVKGQGIGGRNSETVLRCAIEMDNWTSQTSRNQPVPAHLLALSAGTDGIDGNSRAAGALADETTLTRARSSGLDARKFLEASDAYTFFDALGDTLVTGPTGTNVRDLRLLLAV